jgi:hypothetical protein
MKHRSMTPSPARKIKTANPWAKLKIAAARRTDRVEKLPSEALFQRCFIVNRNMRLFQLLK